jgi:hypothetical protein
MSKQALRKRLNQLAGAMEYALKHEDGAVVPNATDPADLRALLAAHAKAERELASVKAVIRLHTCRNPKHNSCRDIRSALKERGIRI